MKRYIGVAMFPILLVLSVVFEITWESEEAIGKRSTPESEEAIGKRSTPESEERVAFLETVVVEYNAQIAQEGREVFWRDCTTAKHRAVFNEAAEATGREVAFLAGLALVESSQSSIARGRKGCNAGARGDFGEIGLAQIRSDTAKDRGGIYMRRAADLLDVSSREFRWATNPAHNLTLGSVILSSLETATGDKPFALQTYNQGPGTMGRAMTQLGIEGTGDVDLLEVQKHDSQRPFAQRVYAAAIEMQAVLKGRRPETIEHVSSHHIPGLR